MKLELRKIAEWTGGLVEDGRNPVIEGAAGLTEAGPTDISFFHNAKYAKKLPLTQAAAVILPLDWKAPLPPCAVLRVKNPQLAFGRVLQELAVERSGHPAQGRHPMAFIAPGGVVDPSAHIGPFVTVEEGASVGPEAIIYSGVYIGRNARVGQGSILYSNVTLRENCVVGKEVIVHAGAVIGSDGFGFAQMDSGHVKVPQVGNVIVEDRVEIGSNASIDRATTGSTRIGEGTKIDNLVQIAHNVQIGKHCIIISQVGIAGSSSIGNGVVLAGQVGVIGHLHIGDGAVIAAQSGIMNDVPPKAIMFGSPARPHKEAMKLLALFGKLPELYTQVRDLLKHEKTTNHR